MTPLGTITDEEKRYRLADLHIEYDLRYDKLINKDFTTEEINDALENLKKEISQLEVELKW